ncbi:MAG: HIT family protein [Anaerolineae bacterium]|nr:HIT family protein [Anaerolineae bacterium]
MPSTTYRAECVFCRIIAGEAPASVVYRDDRTLAFMDINPITRGHTLVVPVEHWENLYDLPDEDSSALMLVGAKVARAAKRALSASGVNLWMANERPAGQVVMHAHLHVIPRYPGDGFRIQALGRARGDRSYLDEVAAGLREALERMQDG